MKPASRTRTLAAFLLVFLMSGTALAIDQPPQDPQQQRTWLVGHLVTDMEALGTFDGNAFAKVPGIVNALTDDQVALLSQYYFLTRSKTEQDAGLYAMQQQGYADEQVNAAKAQVADLLTVMNDQAVACYDQFATMPQPVQFLAQVCYASVPGWCCYAQCYVPEWYYDNGCFVGPCFNAAYAGAWAVPVCRAYYDHGSHFYTTYHNIANTVHARRSTRLAKRHANWFRNHGDLHRTLSHDRLLARSPTASRTTPTRSPVSAQNRVGNRALAVHNRQATAAQAGAKHVRTASYKPAVHNRKSKAGSRNTAARQPKARRQAAQAHVRRASASHPRASRPAAHAARPRPAAHASHPRAAAHAQAHAKSGGHSKHR